MDFGRILEEWEKRNPEIGPQDRSLPASQSDSERSRRHPRHLPVEAELDLHGLSTEEAVRQATHFIESCASRGVRKVLIIHGKGNHSGEEGVLKRAVRELLRKHPLTGMMGQPEGRLGGSGAVWVMVRQRSR